MAVLAVGLHAQYNFGDDNTASNYGYCPGVRRTLNTIREEALPDGTRSYTIIARKTSADPFVGRTQRKQAVKNGEPVKFKSLYNDYVLEIEAPFFSSSLRPSGILVDYAGGSPEGNWENNPYRGCSAPFTGPCPPAVRPDWSCPNGHYKCRSGPSSLDTVCK